MPVKRCARDRRHHRLTGAFGPDGRYAFPALTGVSVSKGVCACEARNCNASAVWSGNGSGVTMLSMEAIGYVRSSYQDTKAIPQGLGAKHEAEGILEILPEFEPGLADIEGFSHLYVIWAFDRSEGFTLAVTPPNDDRPHGVFATRWSRRPNPIGLTVVELLSREGPLLRVRGLDMLEGTPILDIKPYLSSLPPEGLRRGWLAESEARTETKP